MEKDCFPGFIGNARVCIPAESTCCVTVDEPEATVISDGPVVIAATKIESSAMSQPEGLDPTVSVLSHLPVSAHRVHTREQLTRQISNLVDTSTRGPPPRS